MLVSPSLLFVNISCKLSKIKFKVIIGLDFNRYNSRLTKSLTQEMPNLIQKPQNSVYGVIWNGLTRPALYLCGFVFMLETTGRATALGMPGMRGKDPVTSSWWQIKISKRWIMWFLLGEDYQPDATWSERLSSQSAMYVTLAMTIGLLALAYGYKRNRRDPSDGPTRPRRSPVQRASWTTRISEAVSWPINYLRNTVRTEEPPVVVPEPAEPDQSSSSSEETPPPPPRRRGRPPKIQKC